MSDRDLPTVWTFKARASGVLLHPTCFPTRFGVGDLGPEAYRFVDWLSAAQQRFWQVLPLSPVAQGGSPYTSVAAQAGNTLLISPEKLVEDGLLHWSDLDACALSDGPTGLPVDFATAAACKRALLERAWANFQSVAQDHPWQEQFARFCQLHAAWLDPYAWFVALREANQARSWNQWTEWVDLDKRPAFDRIDTDSEAGKALLGRVQAEKFAQFIFFRQWSDLRQYARSRGVRLIGDLPIYSDYESAEVWANRDFFLLDSQNRPLEVAGVPPDYFKKTGQLWNNPLYRWDAIAQDGYRWWIDRFLDVARWVDVVRVDHFRGYEAFWAVPAGHRTAEHGRWVPGPGAALFEALRQRWAVDHGLDPAGPVPLPIIAEDLGHITAEVVALRKQLGLPGMAVLQFGFTSAADSDFLPDRIAPDLVVYPGTHDNDTVVGWFDREIAPYPERLQRLRQYTRADRQTIAWELIELAWSCRGFLAVAMLQDLLALDSSARLNTPGQVLETNWRWRYWPGALTGELQDRLAQLTVRYGRA